MVKPGPTVPLSVVADELPNAADGIARDAATASAARAVFIRDPFTRSSRILRRDDRAGFTQPALSHFLGSAGEIRVELGGQRRHRCGLELTHPLAGEPELL